MNIFDSFGRGQLMIGDKIRSFRLAKNLTIRELADKVGVSHVMITSYENGRANPRPKVLQRIADIFGVSKEDFTNSEPQALIAKENDLSKFDKLCSECKSLDPVTFSGLVIIMEKLVDRQKTIEFFRNRESD
ncbi:MAG: helix-turn-helix transcriptional regulator [Cyclobacteriaceae bacterium]|nr:MAG: helix-turn-helix transcriptional regulator [Cyclobacteriaceae bacterium]